MKQWQIDRTLIGGGRQHGGWLPLGAAEPPPMPGYTITLLIEENDSGVFLLVKTPHGTFDHWHRTFPEAVKAAETMFNVAPEEWRSVEGS